jgi:hypothetical protein
MIATRHHLFLIPLLLLPLLDGQQLTPGPTSCDEHGVVAHQEVFPFSLRYRQIIRCVMAFLPNSFDPLEAPAATNPVLPEPTNDPPPTGRTGPGLRSMFMVFQT